jgi:hypothetical protein
MKHFLFSVCIAALPLFTLAQECFPIDKNQAINIKSDVEFLADDNLQGRAPGTEGIDAARDFIAKRFQKAGVLPMGDGNSYFQTFQVPEPVLVDTLKTVLKLKKSTLKWGTEFYPLAYSANAAASGKTVWVGYGITATDLNYDDYKKLPTLAGKIAVMDISSPDGIHPHSAYLSFHDLNNRIALAKGKGAVGIVLVNLSGTANNPEKSFKKIRSAGLPVLFVSEAKAAAQLKKGDEIEMVVSMAEQKADAFNVIGFVDNGKPTTVVIGAHYDHLGWGGEGSRAVGERAIHNGADDNASGTAALMALADDLAKKDTLTGHNYLFIAFTAEERGLLGSNYFVNHPTFPLANMAYMINMDMVGRLRESQIQISGTGTASEWEGILSAVKCFNISYKMDASGVGPSDHTSFYNQGMPVLHFFTGSHDDYHKPSDDSDKINFKGIAEIVSLIKTVMAKADGMQRLEFQQTKSEESRSVPAFSVTLGVMPDYMYEDGGLRIDGVTEGKPAAAAGLQKGDIITEMGQFQIADIYAYMSALAAFKKGDEVKITYLREGEKKHTHVKF